MRPAEPERAPSAVSVVVGDVLCPPGLRSSADDWDLGAVVCGRSQSSFETYGHDLDASQGRPRGGGGLR
ncbi:hypothetical protein HMPREF9056_03048 [Actinomyces sp. oral taxon 170 str. F0386]|nr:hypothetical protein HMPREF9056_03048 [Actinomyces sp. oral taxon 170 str. F0386]